MPNPELRKNWRSNWITSLYEFANPKLQYMSWVEGPEANWQTEFIWCSSPVECFCGYFDDLSLSDRDGSYLEILKEGLVSVEEVAQVANFHSLAKKYNGRRDEPMKVLNDPSWKIITREAALAWTRLKKIILEPGERELMEELENTYGKFD